MRRMLVVAILVVGLALTLGLSGLVATAPAQGKTKDAEKQSYWVQEWELFEVTVDLKTECGIEDAGIVHLSGLAHFFATFTVKDELIEQGVMKENSHVSGVAEESGAKYQASGVRNWTWANIHSGIFVKTFTHSFVVVGQGQAVDLKVSEVMHVTAKAPTSERERFAFEIVVEQSNVTCT